MDYPGIFLTALRLTWRRKSLWLFGIFTGLTNALLSGRVAFPALFDLTPYAFKSVPSVPLAKFTSAAPAVDLTFVPAVPSIGLGPQVIIWGLIITVGFFLIILTVASQGTLLVTLNATTENQSLSASAAFDQVFNRIERLLLLALLAWAFSLAMAGVRIYLNNPNASLLAIAAFPLVLVVVLPISFGLSLVGFLARLDYVIRGTPIFSALRESITLLRTHYLPLLVLAIVLFLINLLLNTIAAIPATQLLINALFGLLRLPLLPTDTAAAVTSAAVFAPLSGLILVPILALLAGIAQTWSWAVWVLAFRALTMPANAAPPPA